MDEAIYSCPVIVTWDDWFPDTPADEHNIGEIFGETE